MLPPYVHRLTVILERVNPAIHGLSWQGICRVYLRLQVGKDLREFWRLGNVLLQLFVRSKERGSEVGAEITTGRDIIHPELEASMGFSLNEVTDDMFEVAGIPSSNASVPDVTQALPVFILTADFQLAAFLFDLFLISLSRGTSVNLRISSSENRISAYLH